MMALETFPNGMAGIGAVRFTRAPGKFNSGTTTAQSGLEQSFDGPGDLVGLEVELTAKQGAWARDQDGLLTALGIGGAAMRFTYVDPDLPTPAELGLTGTWRANSSPTIAANVGDQGGVAWSNGLPWSNAMNWATSFGSVAVGASAAYDTNMVTLADEHWGHLLKRGMKLGFAPFHFGLYKILSVEAPGVYRIWPRLRVALTAGTTRATVDRQTLVVRPTSLEMVPPQRNLNSTATHVLSLVEVTDARARASFGA